MAKVDKLEKLHKEIFNNFSLEEKKQYYKKLSEKKFKNFLFISEDGTVTLNDKAYNNIDSLQVFLNANNSVNVEVVNSALAVISDYEALKDKYINQYKVATKFYIQLLVYNWSILKIFTETLTKLLTAYEEEPTEVVLATIKDVNSNFKANYEKMDLFISSFIENESFVFQHELATDIKKEMAEDFSSYVHLTKKIEKLEGVVANGSKKKY